MKSVVRALIIIFCFFLVVVFFTKPFSDKVDKDEFEKGFRLIIVGLSKTARNYDYIKLSNGESFTYVIDRLRRNENYQIMIGDSLVKEKNSCDFYYKRKDSIVFHAKNACRNILFNL